MWALWVWCGAIITIVKLIHIVPFVCPGYSFAPVLKTMKIILQKSICLLKYEESTFQKGNLSALCLNRLFLFLFIDTCVSGAENFSAFCAQHQFLLDFYIYFFNCISCHVYDKRMLLFYLYFLLLISLQTIIKTTLCGDVPHVLPKNHHEMLVCVWVIAEEQEL